ncbi:MAG: PHB depolymerase family esterase [Bacteroidota bacterium]
MKLTAPLTFALLLSTLLLSTFIQCNAQPSQQMKAKMLANRTDKQIVVDQTVRNYIVHVPSSYSPKDPVPVVIMFHGTTGTGDKFWRISKWKEKAEREGFIAVFPTALEYCYIKQLTGQQRRATKWVSTSIEQTACPGQDLKDDVKFISKMLDEIATDYRIDKNRIYACGFSNGANFVTSKIATELSDRIAAVGFSGAWLRNLETIQGCPRPALGLMGETDSKWMDANGGTPVPMTVTQLFLDPTAIQRIDALVQTFEMANTYTSQEEPAHTTLSYTNELRGPERELRLSIVRGMGHVFPNGGNNPAGLVGANLYWDFFKQYTLEPCNASATEKEEMLKARNDRTITIDKVEREYIVHVPDNYTGRSPVPAVIMLHGTGGDGDKFWRISGWKEKAEQEGFIAIFPTALVYCYIEEEDGIEKKKKKTKWLSPKIEEILCDGQYPRDDVKFLNAMLDEVEAHLNIDKSRIYFSGFSNGGGFVRSKVMIEMNDRVAAVATMGGLTPEPYEIKGDYISLYAMLGEMDDRVMPKIGNIPIPMTEAGFMSNSVLKDLVDINLKTTQLEDKYLAKEKNKHFTLRYSESLSGNDNQLIISVIKGLQHRYPNGKNNPQDVAAVDVFWPFFMNHSK